MVRCDESRVEIGNNIEKMVQVKRFIIIKISFQGIPDEGDIAEIKLVETCYTV